MLRKVPDGSVEAADQRLLIRTAFRAWSKIFKLTHYLATRAVAESPLRVETHAQMKLACLVLGVFPSFLACGCSTWVPDPSVYRDRFDGTENIEIEPYPVAYSSWAVYACLGARWISSVPDHAALIVRMQGLITGILGASLNIDGKIHDLMPVEEMTSMDANLKRSTKAFVIPLDTIRDIVASRVTLLRVRTTRGTFENDPVIDGEKDSRAYHALKRFLAAVDRKMATEGPRRQNRRRATKSAPPPQRTQTEQPLEQPDPASKNAEPFE